MQSPKFLSTTQKPCHGVSLNTSAISNQICNRQNVCYVSEPILNPGEINPSRQHGDGMEVVDDGGRELAQEWN